MSYNMPVAAISLYHNTVLKHTIEVVFTHYDRLALNRLGKYAELNSASLRALGWKS